MKYSQEIVIAVPREEVIAKMENINNFKHWQKGFQSYTHISGTPGEKDSRSKLVYNMSGKEIEMIETILKNNMPNETHMSYDAKGVYNVQKNYFEEIDESNTRWISYSEFEFSGFMKILGAIMPGMFKKQSREFMEDFKTFAEEGKSIRDKR